MKTINFLPFFLDALESGEKTRARRPMRPQPLPENFRTSWRLSCPYGKVGSIVTASCAEKEILIRINRIRAEQVQDITYAELKEEGFGDTDTSYEFFKFHWDICYARNLEYKWSNNPWVWVLCFERIQS